MDERDDEETDPRVSDPVLTPAAAQAEVDDRIEAFGLDVLPRVQVRVERDGSWRVAWTSHVARCRPMTRAQWLSWLQRHVGETDPERLETSEG